MPARGQGHPPSHSLPASPAGPQGPAPWHGIGAGKGRKQAKDLGRWESGMGHGLAWDMAWGHRLGWGHGLAWSWDGMVMGWDGW